MARPLKEGLEYFPLDVDIDQDDKVSVIEALHGLEGFGVVIKLLMKIYKEGYYYNWTKREQLIFSRRVNVNINTLSDVVNDCIAEGLFNRNMFEQYEILTSKGIQKRYLEAVKRRKQVEFIESYFLLESTKDIVGANKIDVFLVNESGNRVNVNNNLARIEVNVNKSTQRKEKESKEKNSKEKNNNITPPDPAENGQATAWNFYYQNFGVASPFVIDDMNFYIEKMGEELVIEALKRALKENKTKWSYAEGILKAWSKRNIKSLADVEGLDSEFKSQQEQRQQKQQRSGYNKQPVRKEHLPEWFDENKQPQKQQEKQTNPDELAAKKAAMMEKLQKARG